MRSYGRKGAGLCKKCTKCTSCTPPPLCARRIAEWSVSAANRRNDRFSSLFITFRHFSSRQKVRPRRQDYSHRHVFPLVDMSVGIIHAAPRAANPGPEPGLAYASLAHKLLSPHMSSRWSTCAEINNFCTRPREQLQGLWRDLAAYVARVLHATSRA